MKTRKRKKLCIFYNHAWLWIGKPVEWIICAGCRRKMIRDLKPTPMDTYYGGEKLQYVLACARVPPIEPSRH